MLTPPTTVPEKVGWLLLVGVVTAAKVTAGHADVVRGGREAAGADAEGDIHRLGHVVQDRPLKVATPLESVTVPVPGGSRPLAARGRRHRVRAVRRDHVAKSVFLLDNRLRAEGRAGRSRRRRLLVITNWLAAAGLTTTFDELAVKLPALVLKAMFIVSALS